MKFIFLTFILQSHNLSSIFLEKVSAIADKEKQNFQYGNPDGKKYIGLKSNIA